MNSCWYDGSVGAAWASCAFRCGDPPARAASSSSRAMSFPRALVPLVLWQRVYAELEHDAAYAVRGRHRRRRLHPRAVHQPAQWAARRGDGLEAGRLSRGRGHRWLRWRRPTMPRAEGPAARPRALPARSRATLSRGSGRGSRGRPRADLPAWCSSASAGRRSPCVRCRLGPRRPPNGPGHLVQLHPEPAGQPPRVLVGRSARSRIRRRPGRRRAARATRPSAVSRSSPASVGLDRELEQRLPGGDQRRARPRRRAPGAGRTGPARRARRRRRSARTNRWSSREGAQRGLLARGIPVEGEDHLAARARRRPSSSRRSTLMWSPPKAVPQVATAVVDAGQVAGHHVGVALDDDRLAAPARCRAWPGRARRAPGSSVDRRLGGVEVLGPVVVVVAACGRRSRRRRRRCRGSARPAGRGTGRTTPRCPAATSPAAISSASVKPVPRRWLVQVRPSRVGA